LVIATIFSLPPLSIVIMAMVLSHAIFFRSNFLSHISYSNFKISLPWVLHRAKFYTEVEPS